MAGRKKDPDKTAATRNNFIEKAYELYTTKSIESVSMIEVAEACGYGTTTLYRYFPSKPVLVVAVAIQKWQQFTEENRKRRPKPEFEGMKASDIFEFYLDSFLLMYKSNKELLRFNQLFNVYVQSEHIDAKTLSPYREMIGNLHARFHEMYLMAQNDGSMQTDIAEEEMFSTTLHIMLAAVTRYAIGLLYQGGSDAECELLTLKEMLLLKYTNK